MNLGKRNEKLDTINVRDGEQMRSFLKSRFSKRNIFKRVVVAFLAILILPLSAVNLFADTREVKIRTKIRGQEIEARAQVVNPSATLFLINSIGDKYPRHLRGLLLIKETIISNCS